MKAIMPFNFGEQPIRIEDRDGAPWFVLADACRVLELSNVSDAAARLDDDEKDDIALTDAIGRQQRVIAVNEAGLYRLILRSRKDAAKKFSRWLTHDVLPTIRRTGAYGAPAEAALPRDPRQLLAYLHRQAEDMIELQDAKAALEPKAQAYDRIADARGNMNLTEAAKVLKIPRNELTRWMMRERWIYRAKASGRWQAFSDRERAGLLEQRVTRRPNTHGGPDHVDSSVMVTPKGLSRLATEAIA